MMILRLSELPELLGPTEYGGKVPRRLRYLAPDAAFSLLALDKEVGGLIYTDMFRDAHGQLIAHRAKPDITKPPGYSAHGYGLAIDLDLTPTQMRTMLKYVELIELLGLHGWYCHRRDLDSSGSESWHFNYLGFNAARYLAAARPVEVHSTWDHPVEMRIQERYGADFITDMRSFQEALRSLSFYDGAVDGVGGPKTRKAVHDFQGAWGLSVDGIAGTVTQRTLAYASASVVYQPPEQEVS